MIKVLFSAFSIALLFSGCNYHQNKVETTYNSELKQLSFKEDEKTLRSMINESYAKQTYVNLSHPKKLNEVLKDLGNITNRIYVLDINSENIDVPTIPSNIFKVTDFFILKRYIEDRTNYTITIEKNMFHKARPKVVKVSHKSNKMFKKQKVELASKDTSVADTLDRVAHATGYNVVYLQDDGIKIATQTQENSGEIEFIKASHISFASETSDALEVLNYISNALNLYIDIDHENKLIKIGKYQVKYFKLAMNNLDIQGSLEAKAIGSSETAMTESGGSNIATQASIKVFDELEEDINNVIEKNSEFDKKNAYARIDKVTGEVTAKASKKTMNQIQEMIHRFNSTYSKMTEFELDVIDVLVKRKVGVGIDIDLIKNAVIKDTALTIATDFSANSIATVTNTRGNGSSSFLVDAINDFGTIVNRKKYVFTMHNHIPYSRKKATITTYAKNSKLVQTGTTPTGSPTYNTEREMAEAYDGFVFKGKPMIDGSKVSLNLNIYFSALLNLNEKVSGTETWAEPEISDDSFAGEIKATDGDVFVIDSLSIKGKAENYKGIVPIPDFVLGGANNNEYVKRELILLGKVKIRN